MFTARPTVYTNTYRYQNNGLFRVEKAIHERANGFNFVNEIIRCPCIIKEIGDIACCRHINSECLYALLRINSVKPFSLSCRWYNNVNASEIDTTYGYDYGYGCTVPLQRGARVGVFDLQKKSCLQFS